MGNKINWYTFGGAWNATFETYKGTKTVLYTIPQAIKNLANELLKNGGRSVHIPFHEHPAICKRYGLITLKEIIFKPGDTTNSHWNALHLWEKNQTQYKIATGYALSEKYQEWESHSWLFDEHGNIIETTIPWSVYFGFTPDEEMLPFYKIIFNV